MTGLWRIRVLRKIIYSYIQQINKRHRRETKNNIIFKRKGEININIKILEK